MFEDADLLLQKLYASIRSEPFKIPVDDGNDLTLTFFNPDREGWLLKMGEKCRLRCRRREEILHPINRCPLLKVVELKPGRGGGSF